MGLTDAVRAPIGPLPAWGWGAVIIGGVVAYKVVKGRSSSGTNQLSSLQPAAYGVSSPLDATGGYGQTIQNITQSGWPKPFADKFAALSAKVQAEKDYISKYSARIAILQRIPLKKRTPGQKAELAVDIKALAAAKAGLATAQTDFTNYENGLTGTGTTGSVGPTLASTNQILSPSLASDLQQRIVTINGQTYVPVITAQTA